MHVISIFSILFFGFYTLAGNPGVSYQGRIIKPDGTALESTQVQFRMQVRSPGSENCLLYEEIQSHNMAGSSGVFSITLNDGTGTRLDTPTYQMDRIFANRDTMTLDSTRCTVGASYSPNTGDGRKFIVYFKDDTMSAYEPLPVMSLNYTSQSMYALESQKIDKFAIGNILRAVDGSGNPAAAPALDPTQLTNFTNLLAGTSTQYATATQFSSVQSFAKSAPPTCNTGEVLKSNGTSLSCVTGGGSSSYSGITPATSTNTIDNTNFAQTWDWSTATTQNPMSLSANALTTGSLLKISSSSASLNSTNGLLNVANSTAATNGVLARFQSNSTIGSGLTVLNNGNVGVGTASPVNRLHVDSGTNFTALKTGNALTITNYANNGGEGRFGVINADTFGIQASDYNNSNGQDLALNPYGGFVAVGTSAPISILDVAPSSTASYANTGSGSGGVPDMSSTMFIRNRSNTTGSGAFLALSAVSGGVNNVGYIGAVSVSSTGTPNIVIGHRTSNDGIGGGNFAEQIRIDSSGNVGIGTSNPTSKLEVNGPVTATNLNQMPIEGSTARTTRPILAFSGWQTQNAGTSITITVPPGPSRVYQVFVTTLLRSSDGFTCDAATRLTGVTGGRGYQSLSGTGWHQQHFEVPLSLSSGTHTYQLEVTSSCTALEIANDPADYTSGLTKIRAYPR